MSASMTLDASGLEKLTQQFKNPAMRSEINAIPGRAAVAAVVAQAIADNFNQEGPGWAPLKASTIRKSVSQKIAKQLEGMTDEELVKHEAKQRKKGGEPARRILRKTGLLMKSVTVPGAKGNVYRTDKAKLIWGTDLVYAAVHNYGYPQRNIPKREFLTIRDEWMKQLQDYIITEAFKIITARIVLA